MAACRDSTCDSLPPALLAQRGRAVVRVADDHLPPPPGPHTL